MNRRSVRFRTAAGASLALWVLVALFALVLQQLVARQLNGALDDRLVSQTQDRVQLLDAGGQPESLLTLTGEEALVVVLDQSDAIVGFAGTPEPEGALGLPEGLGDVTMMLYEHGGAELESLRVAVAKGETGTVIVANEGEAQRRTIGAVSTGLAAGSTLVGVLAAVVAWIVTGRALSPVTRMRDDLALLQTGQHSGQQAGSVRVPATGDEIESLATAMNGLLAQLDQQTTARKRFISDASHELKSPIANATILIETSTPETASTETGSPKTARDDVLLAELDRMRRLVDDLLFLAKHDESVGGASQTAVDQTAVDLDDLVFDEAERLAIRFAGRVDANGVQPAPVRGDAGQLSQAIRNLLENAATHATSVVTVAIDHRVSNGDRPATVVMRVSDDGPGVADQDRAHIFERFGRASNSRDRHSGGTGLGLSIVAAIASAHGGEVRLAEGTQDGAVFELELPAV